MINTENKFEYNGLIYIAVEEESCRLCDFYDENGCSVSIVDVPSCSPHRQDGRSVCFVLSDIDNEGNDQTI